MSDINVLCGAIVVGLALASGTAGGQPAIVEHHWTDIGASGRTSVDWQTLERRDVNADGPIFVIWAHTEEARGPVVVQVAVRCGPRHAAVIEARRTRDDGSVETAGPVALTDLEWQDPPRLSYLFDIEAAVCARTRDARVRPC
jgi:hypothetical protein